MAFKLFSKDSINFPQEKKQQLLVVVLVVVVLIALIVLYFNFLRPSQSPTIGPAISPSSDGGIPIEDIITKINFDINFLKNPYFLTLKIYGEWPLEIGQKGRVNPFLPY